MKLLKVCSVNYTPACKTPHESNNPVGRSPVNGMEGGSDLVITLKASQKARNSNAGELKLG